MNKSDLEAMIPEIQKRHAEIMDEAKRLEGDFRTVQKLISDWTEPAETKSEEQKGEQAIDAQTQPATS